MSGSCIFLGSQCEAPSDPLSPRYVYCEYTPGVLTPFHYIQQDVFLFFKAHEHCYFLTAVTEGKLQVAQEHIESLEQQLADAEKKASDANQKGIYFHTFCLKENIFPLRP